MNCGVNVMNVTIISLAVNVKTSYDIIDLDHLIQLLQSHLTSPTPPPYFFVFHPPGVGENLSLAFYALCSPAQPQTYLKARSRWGANWIFS